MMQAPTGSPGHRAGWRVFLKTIVPVVEGLSPPRSRIRSILSSPPVTSTFGWIRSNAGTARASLARSTCDFASAVRSGHFTRFSGQRTGRSDRQAKVRGSVLPTDRSHPTGPRRSVLPGRPEPSTPSGSRGPDWKSGRRWGSALVLSARRTCRPVTTRRVSTVTSPPAKLPSIWKLAVPSALAWLNANFPRPARVRSAGVERRTLPLASMG